MFTFLKPKTPCPKVRQPEWFRTRMVELRRQEEMYTSDYYQGWMTDVHFDSKLDELQRELDSAIRQLKHGNQIAARIHGVESELPFS